MNSNYSCISLQVKYKINKNSNMPLSFLENVHSPLYISSANVHSRLKFSVINIIKYISILTWLDLFVCNLLILCHISHCWGQIGISFLALGRAKSVERKCQNRILWGNSELTGTQWAPSRAVLAYVCPKRPNMGQIGPRDIGADLAFRADLALFILQCIFHFTTEQEVCMGES